jgi:transcriptional regulator with XRE-family HTH domain
VNLGESIRAARQRRGWTQEELADKLEVGITSVKNWESGKHEPRSALARIEDVLGTKLTGETREPSVSESVDARLTGELATRLAERSAQIARLEAENQALRAENARLRGQGLEPVELGQEWAARERRTDNGRTARNGDGGAANGDGDS